MRKFTSILFCSLLAIALGLGCSKKSNPDQTHSSSQNLKTTGDSSLKKTVTLPNVGSTQAGGPTAPANLPTIKKEETTPQTPAAGLKTQNVSGNNAPPTPLAGTAEQFIVSAPQSGVGPELGFRDHSIPPAGGQGGNVLAQAPPLEPLRIQSHTIAIPAPTPDLSGRSIPSPSQTVASNVIPQATPNLGNLNIPVKTTANPQPSTPSTTLTPPTPTPLNNVQVAAPTTIARVELPSTFGPTQPSSPTSARVAPPANPLPMVPLSLHIPSKNNVGGEGSSGSGSTGNGSGGTGEKQDGPGQWNTEGITLYAQNSGGGTVSAPPGQMLLGDEHALSLKFHERSSR